jgi:hypothetical protein
MATYSAVIYDCSSILSGLIPCYMIKPDGVEQFSDYLVLGEVYKVYVGTGTPILNAMAGKEMIYEGKTLTDKWYGVRLLDAVDSTFPRTGVAVGSVTVTYGFESAVAETPYAIVAGDWKELGSGNYWLNMGFAEFTQIGTYIVKLRTYPISNDLIFYVKVKDFWDIETIADVPVSHQGTAQAGGASNIQLALTASAIDDFYVGSTVAIVSGLGAGQARIITLYDGGTKWTLVYPAWAIPPNNTSVYKVMPIGPSMIEGMDPALQALVVTTLVNAFHDEDLALHIGAAIDNRTIGGLLVQLRLSKYANVEMVRAVAAVPAQGITLPMAASGVIQYEIVRLSFTRNFAAPDFTYYDLWRYDANQIVVEVKASLGIIW